MAAIAITSQHQKVPYASLADLPGWVKSAHPWIPWTAPCLATWSWTHHRTVAPNPAGNDGSCRQRKRRGTGDDALRIRAGCPGAFGKDVIMARGFGTVGDCTQKCPGIYPMMISPFKLFIDWGLACFGDKPTMQTGHCTTCHFVTHDWESICWIQFLLYLFACDYSDWVNFC